MQTILKTTLPDGRYVEHSRTVFATDKIATNEKQTQIAKAYGLWLDHCLISPFDVPLNEEFSLKATKSGIATHLGIVDVSTEDLSRFQIIHKGDEAMGLQGFSHANLNSLSPNGVHWTLLLDMAWMKNDFRPIYLATELAIDSLLTHYRSLLLPLASVDGSVTRIHIVTRPLLVPSVVSDEAF